MKFNTTDLIVAATLFVLTFVFMYFVMRATT